MKKNPVLVKMKKIKRKINSDKAIQNDFEILSTKSIFEKFNSPFESKRNKATYFIVIID